MCRTVRERDGGWWLLGDERVIVRYLIRDQKASVFPSFNIPRSLPAPVARRSPTQCPGCRSRCRNLNREILGFSVLAREQYNTLNIIISGQPHNFTPKAWPIPNYIARRLKPKRGRETKKRSGNGTCALLIQEPMPASKLRRKPSQSEARTPRTSGKKKKRKRVGPK